MSKSIHDRIECTLKNEFNPTDLKISDISERHGRGVMAGTHFQIRIKSKIFNQMKLIERHRKVYKCLDYAFNLGLHSLELDCESDEIEHKQE